MTDAQDRGWGPGWPNCQTSKWEPLEVVSLRGNVIRFPSHKIRSKNGTLVFEEEVGFPGGVREELYELVKLLLHESERRGYINLQPGWCWGGACRPIKRSDGTLTDVPSNHSWGLALDLNAPENPYGGMSHTIEQPMASLWGRYGFRWGGIYRDWMHFEFMGTPADARRFTETAREELEVDDVTEDEKQTLKDAQAFLDAVRKPLRPGAEMATPAGAGDRVAKATLIVERAQDNTAPNG